MADLDYEQMSDDDPGRYGHPRARFLYGLARELAWVKKMHRAPESIPAGDLGWVAGFELVRRLARASEEPESGLGLTSGEIADGIQQLCGGLERAIGLLREGKVTWEAVDREPHAIPVASVSSRR